MEKPGPRSLSMSVHCCYAMRVRTVQHGLSPGQIDWDFVLIKFTKIKGDTKLGCQLDQEQEHIDLSSADFENAKGHVDLVGNLILNYEKVQLNANIDLITLKGTGYLR